jgi:muramoyltetrapeptide carboxypeptidase
MISPAFLKVGDKVALVAPAKAVPLEPVQKSIEILTFWGLQVHAGKHLFENHHVFAGTDSQRLSDFQSALDNPEIKAIFCARGGYGTVRIIDNLDWTKFIQSPKWIIGFSDITYLHGKIHSLGYQSIHGPMPALFTDPAGVNSLAQLKDVLFGIPSQFQWVSTAQNRYGQMEGELVGGNLTILQQMIGCKGDFDTKGKILFFEEIGEYLYHFERMLLHLKRSGKFEGLKGMLVGHLTDMKDNDTPFGLNVQEIVLKLTKEYSFPVAFDLSFGHEPVNTPLIIGATAKVNVDRLNTRLEYQTSQQTS